MIPQNIVKQSCTWLLLIICLFFITVEASEAQGNLPFIDARNWYQIDVIVFSQTADINHVSETWSTSTPLPTITSAWQLTYSDADESIAAYDILPDNRFGLTNTLTKLTKRSNYRMIWHGAWVQPITKKRSTRPIYIAGGEQYPQIASEQTSLTYQPSAEFAGLLTLKQTQNYISVAANLRLTELTKQLPRSIQMLLTTSSDELYQQFSLQQTQRIRANEIHYFDHPLFGMLIKITPYTPSAATLLATQTKLQHYRNNRNG